MEEQALLLEQVIEHVKACVLTIHAELGRSQRTKSLNQRFTNSWQLNKEVDVKHYDVIISGGAMAGATLALALDKQAQGALSIAIVEAYQTDHEQHPGFDARAIALSHGTVDILKRFDLWKDVSSVATAIEHIHVSDRGHAGMTEIAHSDIPVPALGYVVELADVGRLYHQRIQSSQNIELLCPDSIAQLNRFSDRVELKLTSQKEISGQLLVAADGAFSPICDAVKLQQNQVDFEQVAVIANVVCQQAHQGRASSVLLNQAPSLYFL
ncbi:2-octaprenyl-6-methoxyphenol hydroxylase [Vibrio astriarenae]|nr:2-octaprenyl-6-methoxyphenol hydroxylase [Vibrio sp. C7]